jgi:LysM domain-containing protein
MEEGARSPLRFLAPIALIVAALIALVVIVLSSGGGDSTGAGGAPTEHAAEEGGSGEDQAGQRVNQDSYQVEIGDTLASIADKTGVSEEEIQQLNPGIDPQALIAGQRIKLRE